MLTRITIVMGLIALCTTFLFKEVKNVQLGRQENLPSYSRDQDYSAKDFPALIQLITKDKHKGFCSAFVVSSDYAITAAHCLVDEEGEMKDGASMMARAIEVTDPESAEKQLLITPIEIVGVALRQDYALVIGDFSRFAKFRVDVSPVVTQSIFNREVLPGLSIPLFAIGFPNGIKDAVALEQAKCFPVYDFIGCSGLMYHGMSGGALLDPTTGTVLGVNHAIGPNGDTYFKVMIGLFEAFNVEVE
jgi:hypothetical protein